MSKFNWRGTRGTPPAEIAPEREGERFEMALKAFESALSLEDREAYITAYVKSKSTRSFCPPRTIATKLAILEWFTANSEQGASE
jgi:hypothetical protein